MPDLSGWWFAGFLAIIPLIAGFKSYIYTAWGYIVGRIRIQLVLEGRLAQAMLVYLKDEFEPIFTGQFKFIGEHIYIRSLFRNQLVPFAELPDSARIYRRGWQLVRVSVNGSEDEDGEKRNKRGSSGEGETLTIKLEFIRGTFIPEMLVVKAAELYNKLMLPHEEEKRRRFFVRKVFEENDDGSKYASWHSTGGSASGKAADLRHLLHKTPLGYGFDEFGAMDPNIPPPDPFVGLALGEAGEQIIGDVKTWLARKDYFLERNLHWRHGVLMHGPPGNGKTSIVRAIGRHFDLPIFSFNLAALSNATIEEAWGMMQSHTPCIALFEDLHDVFDGDKYLPANEEKAELSMSTILNLIDGVDSPDGVLLMITTNAYDKVPATLGGEYKGDKEFSRPGRIDQTYEIGNPDRAGRERIASYILAHQPGLWEELVSEGEGKTGAQFAHICIGRIELPDVV